MQRTILTFIILCFLNELNAQSVYEKATVLNRKGEFVAAIKLLQELAQKGDIEACYLLGKNYADAAQQNDAVTWYTKAATKGCIPAMIAIGNLYYDGGKITTSGNGFKIVAHYENGKDTVMNDMKLVHKNTQEGFKQQPEQARKWWKTAADKGSEVAMAKLAWLIYQEDFDVDGAKALLEKIKMEIIPQKSTLGRIYEKEKKLGIAFRYYREAAEAGDLDSQVKIAQWLENGLDVYIDKDIPEAMKWYRRAAIQGHTESMRALSYYYLRQFRKTLKKDDYDEALKWGYKCWLSGNFFAGELMNSLMTYAEGVYGGNIDKNSLESIAKQMIAESDVDIAIPTNGEKSPHIWALIISNEKYEYESSVQFANNDGKIFTEYCKLALGVPTDNIHVINDASLNRMKFEVDWLSDAGKANTDAKLLFYYVGHGVPAEDQTTSFLLPIDGYSRDTSTGFDIRDLYQRLSSTGRNVTIILDACFSGAKRDGEMLQATRGVTIKVKEPTLKGNMVVFSACQGTETALPYSNQSHGMFTYYLLKKLQETSGRVFYGDLYDYLKENVYKTSLKINKKPQTPSVLTSADVAESWRTMKLK